MTSSEPNDRIDHLTRLAEDFFGERVTHVSTPGGTDRASIRVTLESRSVIATLRPNFRRTHLEAYILKILESECDCAPKFMGLRENVLFQSDLGGNRLNTAIWKAGQADRASIAFSAVEAILRIQKAANRVGLRDALPILGANDDWVENLVHAIDTMESISHGRSITLNRAELCQKIVTRPRSFVKWDCRSGNAAVSNSNSVKWFDFEYAGVRHGAEDLAWLIADEAWPINPEVMEKIILDCLPSEDRSAADTYLDYLWLYTSFHCIQRIKLIMKEVVKRGWLSKSRIRKFDDAGVHPEFAYNLCKVGEYAAYRNRETALLARDFADGQRFFLSIMRDGLAARGAIAAE
ncbi:hypothetical protein [Roseivivax sp. THAF30]|uniref:hypothetical protein n=1 Tax=Roseivivax sp. THAF30 TaxID=2587852 RepID=UPI001268B647|nr:hypothetical protein [Roseivivax sp. THAF30]QFT62715.1 hypothetical protein FIU91_07225 [Roseivivax sp. THAF30]